MEKIALVSSLYWPLLGGFLALAACAPSTGPEAPRPARKAAADQPSSGGTGEVAATAAAAAADDDPSIFATITSVEESGELCPPPSNGRARLETYDYGQSMLLFETASGSCELPSSSAPVRCSTTPSCTVTLELDVPAGRRMGVPSITWLGTVDIYGAPTGVTTQRIYAFEGGGDTVRTPAASLADSSFSLTDRGLAAFSPTCAGSTHTRLVATFQAQRPDDDTPFWLDQLIINPSVRDGTQFQDCASGGPTAIQPAAVGDWCGGANQRPCVDGLVCERNQPPLDTANPNSRGDTNATSDPFELMRGKCVDPSQTFPPQEAGQTCGGARNIPCTEDTVCWYGPGVDRSALGLCQPAIGTNGTPCHIGTPWIECGEGLVCNEEDNTCVPAPGKQTGDACSEISFPRCEDPLICRAGACILPSGRGGEPCGDGFPACQTGECYYGTCPEGEVERPPCGAGLPACAQGQVCRKGSCTRATS